VRVAVIPALDEASCVGGVVDEVRAYVDTVVVVDNGSRDDTAAVAAAHGAIVEQEPRRGYGAACLRGLARARVLGASVVVFLDADGSDDPGDVPRLLAALRDGAELALGVRTPETTEAGAMTRSQRFGNWLAPLLMRTLLGACYHDMPPLKAIRRGALDRLVLTDTEHGFTIELLLRAHSAGLRVAEIPVRCRARRAGASKVSGTVVGSARAAHRILTTIAWHALRHRGGRARRKAAPGGGGG
jgi:glycosyltransferase involved in cell wall biosynthesis